MLNGLAHEGLAARGAVGLCGRRMVGLRSAMNNGGLRIGADDDHGVDHGKDPEEQLRSVRDSRRMGARGGLRTKRMRLIQKDVPHPRTMKTASGGRKKAMTPRHARETSG